MLEHVAGDRRQHQHQQRHADRREHRELELLHQREQARAVGPDHPGIGDQVAHRRHEPLPTEPGEGRQHQRRRPRS